MADYKKIYLDYFGFSEGDYIPCECGCKRNAVEIHHLDNKGMGGSKTKDYIENLCAVSRDCHTEAHDSPKFNEMLKEKHLINVKNKDYNKYKGII